MRTTIAIIVALVAASALASDTSGYRLDVLVGDTSRPEYWKDGTVYVEAIRGQNYSLRITNPTGYRVAVALSVDGVNTIDARHAKAWSSSKWVLDPYESTVISGWQVSGRSARKFLFTGESHSYAAALGQTANLGVIEAVFYREHAPIAPNVYAQPADIEGGVERESARDAAASAPSVGRAEAQSAKAATSDEYAATGMGHRMLHEVQRVDLVLEPDPVASMRIRYEFRPQLVRLGVLPPTPSPSPLDRREQAHGFATYCPEVN